LRLVRHRPGAAALRLGLGPDLLPAGSLRQLQALFQDHSFWAGNRSLTDLRRMLRGSEAVVSAWQGRRLVGFGRATSDGIYRAVLWDVVVTSELQGQGLGRELVSSLLSLPPLHRAERVYLMTTNGRGFYEKLGFRWVESQRLMLRE
jgi:ribosomal protein S18 acetylase RimI-like enzyme